MMAKAHTRGLPGGTSSVTTTFAIAPPERRRPLNSGYRPSSHPGSRVPARIRHRRRIRLACGIAGLAALLAVGGMMVLPVSAQETPYEVTLTGVEDGSLRELLEGTATLFRLNEQPPPSPVGLRRRADADQERIQTALRSVGFYDGKVEIEVDTSVEPAKVNVVVTPGPVYTFDRITVAGAGGVALEGAPVTAADLGIQVGQPALAASVVDAENRATNRLAERGFAFARIAERQAVVDHETRTMDVTYIIDPGPLTRYGDVRVQGLDRVTEQLVRNRVPWKPGEEYRPEEIEDARSSI